MLQATEFRGGLLHSDKSISVLISEVSAKGGR